MYTFIKMDGTIDAKRDAQKCFVAHNFGDTENINSEVMLIALKRAVKKNLV